MINADTRLVYPENAKSEAYRTYLEEIEAAKECPFCEAYLMKWKKIPPIKTGKYWLVVPLDFPHENADVHFMFIAKKHVTDIDELPTKAENELFRLRRWLKKKYKLKYGTILMRSGGPETGQTVTHLHAQLVKAKKGVIVLTRI